MKKKRYCVPIDFTEKEIEDLNKMELKANESRTSRLRKWVREGYLRDEGKVLGFCKEED